MQHHLLTHCITWAYREKTQRNTRAKAADRSVTVRGLAEKDVTADLATWTISYSASSTSLAEAQDKVRRDTASIEAFFKELGFPADALQPTGANVASFLSGF